MNVGWTLLQVEGVDVGQEWPTYDKIDGPLIVDDADERIVHDR